MRKVKWGVIGAGGIADRRTIPGMLLANNAELYAVSEINMELAEKLKEKHGAQKAYDNYQALLADPEVEAVYIATPVNFHKEQAIAAARAKKHILIEKPVAFTVEDGEEVMRVCKEEGVKIAVGLMMRFHSYHQVMKNIIAEGKLGQVVSCRGQLTCWFPKMENNWRQQKATAGGGALVDMGVHCIDLIQYITGSKVKRVSGFSANKTFGYEVDDSSSTMMELENGAYAYVDANFNIPDAAARCRLEIYGTKGSMLAEGTISQIEGGKLDVVLADDTLSYDATQDRNDVNPVDIQVTFGNMYTKEVEAISDSILNDTPIEVPIDEALYVQKILSCAYESNDAGKVVTL